MYMLAELTSGDKIAIWGVAIAAIAGIAIKKMSNKAVKTWKRVFTTAPKEPKHE